MSGWQDELDKLISPRGFKCLCCDELSYGEWLCPTCEKALKAMRLPEQEARNGDVYSVYQYEGVAKDLVLLLKEEKTAFAAQALASEMVHVIKQWQLPPETILTWVTMPRIRLIKRGMDHGYELCTAVAEQCEGLQVRQLLQRTGRVHTQRGLSREKRQENLSGTFCCHEELSGPVLLIDDVLTTGATSSVCAEVLLAAGATQVYVLTATKANGKVPRFDFGKVGFLYGLYNA